MCLKRYHYRLGRGFALVALENRPGGSVSADTAAIYKKRYFIVWSSTQQLKLGLRDADAEGPERM